MNIPLGSEESEQLARKFAVIMERNWLWIDVYIQNMLHVRLTKKEALKIARRALDIMEEWKS